MVKTHNLINQKLCGVPVSVEDDAFASVLLETTDEMVVDKKGLIHGGFIFGAADYCAMLTVNHPNVVLGKAEVRFLKPVKKGEKIHFEGVVKEKKDNKRYVEVIGKNEKDSIVFYGVFVCYILEKHVLDR